MVANLIRWSVANRFLVVLASLGLRRVGHVRGVAHAARRHPRSQRRAGDHLHPMGRPHPEPRRGPDHLSHRHQADLGAEGARVRGYSFFGYSFVYVRVRGRHGHLLGALARARIHAGQRAIAAGRHAHARAGCHRCGLGFPVRARGPQRHERSRRPARFPGLAPALLAAKRRRRCGSRDVRWLRKAISGRTRSQPVARLQPAAHAHRFRHSQCEQRHWRA